MTFNSIIDIRLKSEITDLVEAIITFQFYFRYSEAGEVIKVKAHPDWSFNSILDIPFPHFSGVEH